MNKTISPRIIALTFGILTVCFAVAFSVVAWTEPSQAPPDGNVAPPLRSESAALNLNGSTWSERNITNINTLQGYNDLFLKGNSAETATIYYGGDVHRFYTGGTEKMTIINNGNVGIGTASPGAKLEVAGQVKITGGTPGAGKVLTSDASGLASWGTITGTLPSGSNGQTLRHNGTSWIANSVLFNNGTNVGIGTTNPGYKLDVSGDIRAGSSGAGYAYIGNRGYYIGDDLSGSDIQTNAPNFYVNDGGWKRLFREGDDVNSTLNITGAWDNNTTNALHLAFDSGIGIGRIYSLQNGAAWRKLYVDGSSLALNSVSGGKVSIGITTTEPRELLDLKSSGHTKIIIDAGESMDPGITLKEAGTDKWIIDMQGGTDNFKIRSSQDNYATRLAITQAGHILQPPKTLFFTKQTYNGSNLGGYAGADAKCAAEAPGATMAFRNGGDRAGDDGANWFSNPGMHDRGWVGKYLGFVLGESDCSDWTYETLYGDTVTVKFNSLYYFDTLGQKYCSGSDNLFPILCVWNE